MLILEFKYTIMDYQITNIRLQIKRAILLKCILICNLQFVICNLLSAQTNILSTNLIAEQVMLGNYNPQDYMPSTIIDTHDDIITGLVNHISSDSLKSYIIKLASFYTRHTASDTVSADTGIGAARRWAYNKFQQFSTQNENRLVTSYLQFNQDICGVGQHRNVFTVLPGSDTSRKDIVIIEAHMDAICNSVCDTSCHAEGVEDNASGSALVLELARVMGKYSYLNTIVFLLTIGEEQGLLGASAFAKYVQDKGIQVKAIQNNDVVGGIYCGETASPPTTCINEGDVDSTTVRLFSYYTSVSSKHRNYARFVKLEYIDELQHLIEVPMNIQIMDQEDRTGRGGDHIPFRQRDYTAIRFCAAHEHGNGNINDTSYSDRQHTSNDILGVDTDMDLAIDSFFVDFNYLRRNTLINGNAAAMAAIGKSDVPEFELFNNVAEGMTIHITSLHNLLHFRVMVSSSSDGFDAIYSFKDNTEYIIPNTKADSTYYISVMSVDENGIESLFSDEQKATAMFDGPINTSLYDAVLTNNILEILPVFPNPTNQHITIPFVFNISQTNNIVCNIVDIYGKEIKAFKVSLKQGLHFVKQDVRDLASGIYMLNVRLNNDIIHTQKVVISRE